MTGEPTSVLSRELLPASIAIFATSAMAAFQALGIAAALPDIAADLGDVSLLPWVITAFLVTSSLATVVAGPYIDSVGVARIFRIAIVTFALAGFAAAFAPSMQALIAFRVLQGAGAGLVLSSGYAAVSLVFPERLVGRAFAANATVWGIMGVAGPAVAAAILTFLSWQWILYVNLPLGAIALAAGWRVLPGAYGRSEGRSDAVGPIFLAIMTVALLVAVDSLDLRSLILLLVVVIAGYLYVRHARSVDAPVVRLEHIVRQPYRGMGLATALILTGTFALNSYVPLYIRAARGGSSALSAWSVLPVTVGWTVGANISSRLAARHSESWIILLGLAVNAPALAVAWLLVRAGAPVPVLFVTFTVVGIGVGMTTNATLTLLRAVTDSTHIGRVSSANLFARNLGISFGAAIGGAVLLFVVTRQIGDVELVRELMTASDALPSTNAANAVRDGFAAAILVGVVASTLGLLSAVGLRRSLNSDRAAKRD